MVEVDGDEITAVDPVVVVETFGEVEETIDARPMKDHIDLESQMKKPPPKDLKEIAGSFWLAASVFSKKLQKWRTKQKLKKMKKHEGDRKADDAKSSRRFRETQSEIAVDVFGRRSCDLDPRFSLDAGRISFDDGRYSFDEPRASWDGYLIGGGRSLFPRPPPMLSVVEDAPSPMVRRADGEIPVEEDLALPGGSAQTKDYYSDSSSRSQRRSLDLSNSVKRVSVEVNESKPVSNAKVSPTSSSELFRDWSSTSLREDRSESFESAFREDSSAHKLPPRTKSKRWSKAWSIWGFIHRRSRDGGNVVDRSFSEPWTELRTNGCHANGRMLRSNSSTSSRSSIYGNAGFGSMRRNGLETNGIGKKRRDEFVLERNRSARYSPGHADNGTLRFYLTPMRRSRRGSGKGKHNNNYHSFARSVLQLY